MSPIEKLRVPKRVGTAMCCAGAFVAALMMASLAPAAAQSLTPIGAVAENVQTATPSVFTSYDISFVDPVNHIYALADRSHQSVDLINTQTNKFITSVGETQFVGFTGNNNTSGPNGVMIFNNQIWAGDGNSTIRIYSESPWWGLIKVLNTGGTMRADEMCFDLQDQVAVVANDADNPPFITFWNTSTLALIKKLPADGGAGHLPNATNGIEQCQYNPRTGTFWLNLPEVNGPGDNSAPGNIVEISPTTQSVLNVYVVPLTSCSGPQGLAIGPAPQMLLGCNGGPSQAANGYPTAIINDGSTGGTKGSVFATLTNEAGSDEVWYDSFSNTYQLAESSFNPPPPNGTASCTAPVTAGPQHLGVVGAAPTPVEGTSIADGQYNCPASPHGSNHSVAADSTTGHVFLPVAGTSGAQLCSQYGIPDTNGCIMVFQAKGIVLGANVVWHDTSGDVAQWTVDGSGSISAQAGLGNVPTNWSIAGLGDFNGDRMADVLWRNTSTGESAIWFLSNGQFSSGADIGQVPLTWTVAGTADFNGDGMSDILWRDNSGNLAIWQMNGSTLSSGISLGSVGTQWSVAGTGDFNGDGLGDILWRNNATGDVAIWLMNNGQVSSGVDLGQVPLAWQVAGTGDFNGNGTSDILWRNTQTGDVAIWYLNNGQFSSGADLGQVPLSWAVAGTGDFDGGGTSSILWRNTSGSVALWDMSNGQQSNVGAASTAWSIAGVGSN